MIAHFGMRAVENCLRHGRPYQVRSPGPNGYDAIRMSVWRVRVVTHAGLNLATWSLSTCTFINVDAVRTMRLFSPSPSSSCSFSKGSTATPSVLSFAYPSCKRSVYSVTIVVTKHQCMRDFDGILRRTWCTEYDRFPKLNRNDATARSAT